jgi:tol-pal system protein YbgF
VIRPVLPLLALLLGGCFATTQQVQQLQTQLGQMRAESARRDSVELVTLTQVVNSQQRMADSLRNVRTQLATVKGDLSNDLYGIQQQLLQLQELTGQSQQRLTELRTRLEARGAQMEASPVPGDSARPTPQGGASADQMYEASLAQLRRGSLSTARLGLREMLRQYPTSERAPDALYFIGQSFASENPDSAAAYYREVVDKYPTSPRAAAALYNLGLRAERRKDMAGARDAYQLVTQKYPQSDEAALARDRLKVLGR